MDKKDKRIYNFSHLNLMNVFDRGAPLLKIVLVSFVLLFLGLTFSFLHLLAWIGGLVIVFVFVPAGVWLYLTLK